MVREITFLPFSTKLLFDTYHCTRTQDDNALAMAATVAPIRTRKGWQRPWCHRYVAAVEGGSHRSRGLATTENIAAT